MPQVSGSHDGMMPATYGWRENIHSMSSHFRQHALNVYVPDDDVIHDEEYMTGSGAKHAHELGPFSALSHKRAIMANSIQCYVVVHINGTPYDHLLGVQCADATRQVLRSFDRTVTWNYHIQHYILPMLFIRRNRVRGRPDTGSEP